MSRLGLIACALSLAIPSSTAAQGDGSDGQREDGDIFGVSVSGYGSFRFEASSSDARPASFTFRRFILNTDASVGDRIRIYSEIEFERFSEIEVERKAEADAGGLTFEQGVEGTNESELAVEQIWAQYDFAPFLGLRFGAVLPPVGRFNLRHDDDLWDVPRRPLVDRGGPVIPIKAAWTEMGAGLIGSVPIGAGGRLEYEGYVLNGVTLDFALEEKIQTREPKRDKLEVEAEIQPTQGAFDGSNTADAVTWRLAYSPALGSELAFSGYAGEYTPDFLAADETLISVAGDGLLSLGAFQAEGEFVYTKFNGLSEVLSDFARVVGKTESKTTSAEAARLETEIEFDLKNLARERWGFWVDLKLPFWPTVLNRTFLGKSFESPRLIPIVRLERIRWNGALTGLEVEGGMLTERETEAREQDRVTVGLTYRPVPSVAVQFAYEHNERRKGAILFDAATTDKSTDGFLFGMAFGF